MAPLQPFRQQTVDDHPTRALGDQLGRDRPAFERFEAAADVLWMAEATDESTRAWSAKQRIADFLMVMSHPAGSHRVDGREDIGHAQD